jgi:hypothetical protein
VPSNKKGKAATRDYLSIERGKMKRVRKEESRMKSQERRVKVFAEQEWKDAGGCSGRKEAMRKVQ